MPRALISVYDKTDIVKFAAGLYDLGWELVASGGTLQVLVEAGLQVTSVEELTGVPEMLGGRVKTLHPAIHAGILARATQPDQDDLKVNGYAPFEMVVCNLYPFQETVARSGVTLQDAVEQIDIGGVTLLRSAAKNFFRITALCSPADYSRVLAAIRASGETDMAMRKELAMKAFTLTRDYDAAIHAYLAAGTMTLPVVSDDLPNHISISLNRIESLRYGENAHQQAAYYCQHIGAGPLGATIVSEGKQLSYNNILDLDAAWRAVSSFSAPTTVIVKHLTPTGIASANTLAEAFLLALESDPISAFGSVIAVNRPLDQDFIEALGSLFVEAVAAPHYTSDALESLLTSRKNCRVLQIPQPYDGMDYEIRTVHRGVLVQRTDAGDPEGASIKTVTTRPPTTDEFQALEFSWKAVQHVKSNAIVIATSRTTVGIGGGLSSRVDAVELAVKKAGDRAKGAVLASDAFFPFADGITTAAQAGVTAIIQPGGSIRDGEIIAAANEANISMLFTGVRHFRH